MKISICRCFKKFKLCFFGLNLINFLKLKNLNFANFGFY
ncbi:hypothetical protein CHAB381_1506 [Campylobacter hominis ATCC BAA-381]|uniref:Uncharacterized protein n=1 Tax=Campylobacter hominis (strain ATCC BAA-381 / DSM 21671 / CCUG 45161 / LMG 19568 / NCTC 13146 / CH001A) TaxID=360107 RepID=A7I3F0_CAMHC|nr:hypothetical protein CHAB381_1506 [Campylobacter hominis ATCC BAA-381]